LCKRNASWKRRNEMRKRRNGSWKRKKNGIWSWKKRRRNWTTNC